MGLVSLTVTFDEAERASQGRKTLRHYTQHNDIQHNDTQHNDIQHNDTQHNGPSYDTQHK
jgi:hypothetical protein